MSNTKLGLLVFWPTFWTGFPIKMVVALLLLAAHMHPWEGSWAISIVTGLHTRGYLGPWSLCEDSIY